MTTFELIVELHINTRLLIQSVEASGSLVHQEQDAMLTLLEHSMEKLTSAAEDASIDIGHDAELAYMADQVRRTLERRDRVSGQNAPRMPTGPFTSSRCGALSDIICGGARTPSPSGRTK